MTVVDWRSVAEAELHPIRVAVLERAVAGEVSPVTLAEHLDEPLGNVAYHVRMLVGRGLLRETRTAQRRGAIQHFYRATSRAIQMPPEGDEATTAVEARGSLDARPGDRAANRVDSDERAAGALLTGQRRNGSSRVPAYSEQDPGAVHGGPGLFARTDGGATR